ncbi:MAG: hypothetical protein ACXADY_12935 [Candidatus Hodarchaeales archaeon]
MMKKQIFTNKELLIAVLLTGLYILTGFNPNPIAWPEQAYHRIALSQGIQPNNLHIQQLEVEFREFFEIESRLEYVSNKSAEEKELRVLETFIEYKIPYITDIDNYLAWEHIPTISKVLERGDDCDGIAIVTASLLERLNYECYVVFGKWHSWIEVHLEDSNVVTLFAYSLPTLSTWYVKFNAEEIHIKKIFYLEVILHNYLIILLLIKTTMILVTFFRNHEVFQSVYTTLIALLLSPIPALFILSMLTNT